MFRFVTLRKGTAVDFSQVYVPGMFLGFVAMLAMLMVFHHHKMYAVGGGFIGLSLMFIAYKGAPEWVHHFAEHHRRHLLLQLAMLLPGFSLAAHYFEESGASRSIAQRLDWSSLLRPFGASLRPYIAPLVSQDTVLLWCVFWLSTVLDNIAAAMIGGTILMALYGSGNVPFSMLIGVIAASNLGGAGSPVGDTTTVMMFISENPSVPVPQILKAFVATVPAQMLLVLWASQHDRSPISAAQAQNGGKHQRIAVLDRVSHDQDGVIVGATDDAEALAAGERQPCMQWRMVLPLLGVPGLIVGNIYDQPGFGLWGGIILGMLLGWVRFERKAVIAALPNTVFLVTLVGAAEMLPFQSVVTIVMNLLQLLMEQGMAPLTISLILLLLIILIGLLSAYFDNIPLMAACLSMMRLGLPLDAGFTAYALGFEGSAMWFGSSAGVALGLQYPELYDTKRWWKPYCVVTGIFFAGAAAYAAVFYGILPWMGL